MIDNTINFRLVDAFTDTPLNGNPAGVVLDADDLSDTIMQKIANEIHASETAFVLSSDVADFHVRFFTPECEIPLCSHATIATFHTLANEGIIKPDIPVTQQTGAGMLSVVAQDNNGIIEIMMSQNSPEFAQPPPDIDVADALGINIEELHPDYPIECVSTGVPLLIVPITTLDIVKNMKPNLGSIKKLSEKMGCVGIHVVAFDSINTWADVHVRFFAPLLGVNEDPATGIAHGALCGYAAKNHIFPPQKLHRLVAEQGFNVGRVAKLVGRASTKGDNMTEIEVGGSAVTVLNCKMRI
ncbi:MAG: PhzF family phenazine biosynthesis protein [Methanosarcinales archaeon]|nr:PhzF family phenazine biosynthesis protein [Methanosarcinales archaeon]